MRLSSTFSSSFSSAASSFLAKKQVSSYSSSSSSSSSSSFFSFNRSSSSTSSLLQSSASSTTVSAITASIFSPFRFCSSSSSSTTPSSTSSSSTSTSSRTEKQYVTDPRDLPTPEQVAEAQRKHNEMWMAGTSARTNKNKKTPGLQKTSILESIEQQQQKNTSSSASTSPPSQLEDDDGSRVARPIVSGVHLWCSVPTLYRRFIKLFVKKFKGHPDIIIRAWKQLKYEFFYFRQADDSEIPELVNERGRGIYNAIQGGIIPIIQDQKTGIAFCKYDKKTLEACGGIVDPISVEQYIRRNKDNLSKEEIDYLREQLKKEGRWEGPDELSEKDVPKIKTKRKVKCTDPDES